ncbi:Homeodomain-like superfamily protein [Striga hermonthica]|uniref:Homeodomain-like superfamily protein n=1 Tax=Striga hermonthica TaxID=68872 RepID=A0A9N7R375_STRHE|nr:Homeodomain-like superfamily protein [Striga hermonthica]
MPNRRRTSNEEQKTTTALRRSPRFIHRNQACVEYSETPRPTLRKSQIDSFSTPCHSEIQKNGNSVSKSSKKPRKDSGSSSRLNCAANFSGLVEKRVTRSSTRGAQSLHCGLNHYGEIPENDNAESNCWGKSSERCIRSSRLEDMSKVGKSEEILDSEKQHVVEKRVTRSSLGNKSVNDYVYSDKDVSKRVRASSTLVKAKAGVDFPQKSTHNIEKRVTRGALLVERPNGMSTHMACKVVVSNERKTKGDGEENREAGERKCKRKMQVGVKRKRDQTEGDCEFNRAWSQEQELALRRAYFAAKPTPQFWKKVSKMVHGKSAEECFNRIHYNHLTPPQPRTRSRTNKKEQSPVPYSASKLLSPAGIRTKKIKSHRRTLVAQKTVRQILEKQCNENHDYKADLFSVLEPGIELSSLDFQISTPFVSPVPNRASSVLSRCLEMSSSAPHKKQHSRLSCSQSAAFVSPPVLKQIKNKALHDKYIDQLHCRDARRKMESLRNLKCVQGKKDKLLSHSQVNLVKSAKDALFFDAQEAITKFRSLQSSTNGDIDEDDKIIDHNDENEEDDDELC